MNVVWSLVVTYGGIAWLVFLGSHDILSFKNRAQPAQGPACARQLPTTSNALLVVIQLWSTKRTRL